MALYGPAQRRPSNTLYKVLQTLAIGLGLILAAGILKIGVAAYIAFAFCGAYLVFLTTRPSPRDILISAAIGCGFAIVYLLHRGTFGSYFGRDFAAPGSFLGMGAVQYLAIRWICAPKIERRSAVTNLLRCALIPLLCMGSMVAVGLSAQLMPVTYDRVLFNFDLHLDSASASWQLGAFFRTHPWFHSLCGHVYNTLPLALSACLALQWREELQQRKDRARFPVDLGVTFLALGIVGFALYWISPASGPAYLFPKDFPSHLPALADPSPAPLPTFPRNGMPSLHVAWTFLVFWNLRTRRILGPLMAAFLILTALATLGLGEHYLADLIVAIPLALTIQVAVLKTASPWRLAALSAGTIITLAWLIALRTGMALALPSGAPLWGIVGGTILLPLGLVWQSERAALRMPRRSFATGLRQPLRSRFHQQRT